MTAERGGIVSRQEILRMTTDIVAAYSRRNSVGAEGLTQLITQVHATFHDLANGTPHVDVAPVIRKPAVAVRRSVNPDFLVCLEDGRKLKMLKRHLRAAFNMTPEEYRSRWNLPLDYPMVAPNYAKRRSDFAKKMGLGKRS